MNLCWDSQADFYNEVARMELPFTGSQLDCLDIQPTDTVLDVGCGPGRISVLAARRARRVTSLDASAKMLERLRENAGRMGLDNIDAVFMDWFDANRWERVRAHDIVIASRTEAMRDVEGLSALAGRTAAVMLWANAPSIPDMINTLYAGVQKENYAAQAGPPRTRENGYNQVFDRVYAMGYEPNVRILPDGFTRTFADRAAAASFFWNLRPGLPEGRKERLLENLDPYLTTEADGRVTFLFRTRTSVIWWRTDS